MLAAPRALQHRATRGDKVAVRCLAAFRAAMLHALKVDLPRAPIAAHWPALMASLHAEMSELIVEQFRVLHLNTRHVLIRNEVMSQGSIDEAAVYVREVMRRAIELGSAGLILVHNHPSGDPTPSSADIALTRTLMEVGKRLEIAIYDHVVIARTGRRSMRELNLI